VKVKEVVYSRTKQAKQYEPEHIELRVELEDGDDPAEAICWARAVVNVQLGIR